MIVDAFENEILIGDLYGYSTTSSSWGRVVVGRVTKINEEKSSVRLEILFAKDYLSGKPVERHWVEPAKAVTMASWRLFPVRGAPLVG
jgi:hypothetical protein